jgi:hypothetical protein
VRDRITIARFSVSGEYNEALADRYRIGNRPHRLSWSVGREGREADESVLYIIDSRRNHIRAFDVVPNGTLAKQTDRLFADLRGIEPGNADGMKVEIEGNIYTGGAGGK